MGVFFAIDPPAQTKLAIDAWRAKSLPDFDKQVRASNFHITLEFLGDISPKQLDSLTQGVDQLTNVKSFSVQLDHLGYWPKPKVLWLGTEHCQPAHLQLVESLRKIGRSAGIEVPKQDYIAHLSLVRKCKANPPAALIDPLFTWKVNEFHLFKSVSGSNGVIYQRQKTWPLQPTFGFER
ncbi:MAG: 2'-5' RNA ligase [Paraglaciecola sp.]|jgi:2'-5' RNA ligase